jgi:polar amino acid transport system substrate-binding protein
MFKKYFYCLVLIIGFTVTAVAGKANDRLLFATGEWLPYTSEKLEGGGAIVEIVRSVVAEMGMQPEFIFLPWKRAERVAEIGKVFAAFPYGITEERQSRFEFSNNLYSAPTVFFYLRGELPIKNYKQFEELRMFRVGGNTGYNYVPWFARAGITLHLAESQKQLIRMLEKKRVDLVAIDRGAGWMIIDQLFPNRRDQFATLPRPIEQNDSELGSHLMVSPQFPNHRMLIRKFNKALETIKNNGTYDQILKKHGLIRDGMN